MRVGKNVVGYESYDNDVQRNTCHIKLSELTHSILYNYIVSTHRSLKSLYLNHHLLLPCTL